MIGLEKDKEEIIKKHITNMNKFCNENIDFESGKKQLELIYKYYTKRFLDKDVLYKYLIVLKNEIDDKSYYKSTKHWMRYFVSCSGNEWKELWSALL